MFFVNLISLNVFQFLFKYYNIMFIIIVFSPPRGSGWVIGVGYLGNSSTASGRGDPRGTVGPSYSLGRRDFFYLFRARFTFFHTRVFF